MLCQETTGILKRAAEAKDKNQRAKIEEQRQLTIMEANTNLKETTYQNVKIPAGMAVSQVEGENTLEKGLFAIDKKGNEWVWIEVPKSIYTDATYTAANSNNNVTSSTDYTGIYKILNKMRELEDTIEFAKTKITFYLKIHIVGNRPI